MKKYVELFDEELRNEIGRQDTEITRPFEKVEVELSEGVNFVVWAKKIEREYDYLFQGHMRVQSRDNKQYKDEKVFFRVPRMGPFGHERGLEIALFGKLDANDDEKCQSINNILIAYENQENERITSAQKLAERRSYSFQRK